MPKPPSYSPRQIAEVVEARTPEERVRAYAGLARHSPGKPGDDAQFELVLELASDVAARGHRPSYEAGAPSGVLALAGAIDLMPLLPEGERGLALLEAIGAARAGGLEPRPSFSGWPWSHDLGHDATMDDMDDAHSAKALPRFHGRLVPFLNEETRRKYGHRYLYNRTVLDHANGGHRHILTGRSMRLAEALRWRNSEETLHALSHYFLYAPTDYRAAEVVQEWLQALGKDIPGDNRGRKAALAPEEAEALQAAVLADPPGALIERVVEVWKKGHSLEAVAEVLMLVPGARLRARGADETALRGVLFVDSSLAAFPWLRGHDGVVQLLLVALFLHDQLGAADAGEARLEVTPAAATATDDPAALAREITGRSASGIGSLVWAAAPALLGMHRRSAAERKAEHLAALAAAVAPLPPSPHREPWSRLRPA